MLWKIGIAHRDVSSANLMCVSRNDSLSGVLNDYDFATVMDPGSRCPENDGYDRAGTTPFMSVDLLDYPDAKMERWYRYDLESFTWCLTWEMLKSPPRKWSEGKPKDVYISKRASMIVPRNLVSGVKKKWFSSFRFNIVWFGSWEVLQRDIDCAVLGSCFDEDDKLMSDSETVALRDVEEEKKDDKDYVKFAVAAAKVVKFSKDVDVLQDASWIFVELLPTLM